MYGVPFLEKTGLFTSIDIQFAGLMETMSSGDDPNVALAAALASRNVRYGDVCLDLAVYAGRDIEQDPEAQGSLMCPDLRVWQGALLNSDIVGEPGDYRPLILDHRNRLYLYRYWEYEKKLGDALLERAIHPLPTIDSAAITDNLERLFPEEETDETNWQKIAALVAVLKRLCVISGGPGTGKTFAVARILAFLLEQHHDDKGELRIFLAAPTGKAASRLTESIAQARKLLPCKEAIKRAIPDAGLTIHRLLKSKGQSSRFIYNAENRLPADVVVVDEASMVDLPLMSKLVQALSPATRLILLGDADQLASVEAGSVLGDICGEKRTNRFSKSFLNQIKSVSHIADVQDQDSLPDTTGLHDCSVHLLKSYRFDKKSSIPLFSHVVNQGRVEKAMELLEQGKLTDLDWLPLKPGEYLLSRLKNKIIQYYGRLAKETDPAQALDCINSFKILCAVNHGNFGVMGINQLAVQVLAKHLGRGYAGGRSIWYHGRPVLIRKNDYQLELFNGDLGVILQDRDNPENLLAFFKGNDGEIRRISPLRLPEHETAYAMTIHKSQGSEFDEVLMVLPENDIPVLTRELIYTGITRSRRKLSILSPESAIRLAVARRIKRTSGLRDRLTVNG